MISIKDVARHAGVSVGTVSNVINRPGQVSADIRARVTAVIDELGYVRSESARHLRAGDSRIMALLVLDMANPFFVDVARGAERAALDAGLRVMMCNSGQDPAEEAAYLSLFAEQRVRGVLVTPADADGANIAALPPAPHPVRGGRPGQPRRGVLFGLGGRRGRRRTGRPAPGPGRTPADRLRQRPVLAGPVPRPPLRRAGGPRGGGAAAGRADRTGGRADDGHLRTGRRLPAARPGPPADRGVLRQRPGRPRRAAGDVRRGRAGTARRCPSSATTTSSSRRRPPCR